MASPYEKCIIKWIIDESKGKQKYLKIMFLFIYIHARWII